MNRRWRRAQAKAPGAAGQRLRTMLEAADAALAERRAGDAEAAARAVLALAPGEVNAQHILAVARHWLGHSDEACALLAEVVRRAPDFADAHNSLGNVLRSLGRADEAERHYGRALALRPDFVLARLNLASSYRLRGRLSEAITAYRALIDAGMASAEVYNNLGNAWGDQGRHDEAIAAFERALALRPDFGRAASNLLMQLHYDAAQTPQSIARAHRQWAKALSPARGSAKPFHNTPMPERRLRVGYVSADLRTHSVASFFEPILHNHNRDAVEAVCFDVGEAPDATTARLRGLANAWIVAGGLSDSDFVERVRASRIDILVDLSGHSAGNRLRAFARRCAPVQVSYLGYPDTTGLEAMDYRLTDAVADPPGGSDEHASERLIRLNPVFLCYAPPEDAPVTAPPPAAARGYVTFGSFNNIAKTSTPTLRAWAAILAQMPGSRLFLKHQWLSDPGTGAHVLERLTGMGIDAHRVTLMGHTAERRAHLDLYGEIDIALDPFPYNGTTTTCEALWMGVPVVALVGDRHSARVGASILRASGLAELAAPTENAYVATAVALAHDDARRESLRTDLRGRLARTSLLNARAFVDALEAAYRDMWRRWCADYSTTASGSST